MIAPYPPEQAALALIALYAQGDDAGAAELLASMTEGDVRDCAKELALLAGVGEWEQLGCTIEGRRAIAAKYRQQATEYEFGLGGGQ